MKPKLLLGLLLSIATTTGLSIGAVSGTDYWVSSMLSDDLIDTVMRPGTNVGSAAGETKLSQDSSYQSGTTVYGPNNPIIYSGITAELKSSSAAAFYLNNVKITVTITASSGAALSSVRLTNLGMLVSPADPATGGTDWASVFQEIVSFLFSVKGIPSIPNIQYGKPDTTGIGSDANSVWGRWINPMGSSWDVNGKGILFRYQPNFPNPDVYTVNVQSQAELWINGIHTLIYSDTASFSSSYQYVYENDAAVAGDAGGDFGTARSISPGSHSGLLYGADSQDWYQFWIVAGQRFSVSLNPPSGSNFDLKVYDPNGGPLTGSFNGAGATDSVTIDPSVTGYYRAQIYTVSGSGPYSFSVTAKNDAQFVSQTPPPSTMCSGSSASVSVTMKNIGGSTWSSVGSNPYRLGSQNPQDNEVWGMGRVGLTTTVGPGTQYTFSWTITAPTTPGTYNFQWRMVQELVEWFGAFSTNVPVSVRNCTVTIRIVSNPTTDIWDRSHGLSVDQPLPNPWWPPYQSGYQFKKTNIAFDYTTTRTLSIGSHYVQEAASGFLPNYAWHTKIYINGVLTAEGDVARDRPLQANFSV